MFLFLRSMFVFVLVLLLVMHFVTFIGKKGYTKNVYLIHIWVENRQTSSVTYQTVFHFICQIMTLFFNFFSPHILHKPY